MATKRRSSTELGQNDGDEDDQPEDCGQSGPDVLNDRVIKKAIRCSLGKPEGESVSVLAGFGGFNTVLKEPETQTKPFEFFVQSPKQGEDQGLTTPKVNFKFELPDKQQEGTFSLFAKGNVPREPPKPLSGFSTGEKEPTSSFSVESANANVFLGAKNNSYSSFFSFKFGSTEPSKTSISFGATTSKPESEDVPQRSFSFGGSPSKTVMSEISKPDNEESAKIPSFSSEMGSQATAQPDQEKPSLMELGSSNCSMCDVTNTVDKESCIACGSMKSSAGGAPKGPAKKCECPTFPVSNDAQKCECRETTKPGSSTSAAEPLKKLGGFKFGSREGSSGTLAPTTAFNFATLPASTTPDKGIKFDNASSNNPQVKTADTCERYPEAFLEDLKELNYCVSEWIKTHVDKNGYIYLTPIFSDYEKHLSELKEQYKVQDFTREASAGTTGFGTNGVMDKKKEIVPELKTGFTFGTTATTEPRSSFSFGSAPLNSEVAKGTSFSSSSCDKKSEDSFGSKVGAFNTPFSFGSATGFTFGSIAPKTSLADKGSSQESGDEEDNPPEVQLSPIFEEDSLFSIRCKIFYKKDSEFVEKGLGMLYLKPVEADGVKKTQMLIRADTNLGNILLNIILSSKMNFLRRNNNLQFVCIPNPSILGIEAGPVTMLIKVKDAEAATDLETHVKERLTKSH